MKLSYTCLILVVLISIGGAMSMGRRLELEDLLKEIGLKNLNDLVTGCGQIAMLLNELPAAERIRLQARLNQMLEDADDTLPFAGKFLIEVITKGLNVCSNGHGIELNNTRH